MGCIDDLCALSAADLLSRGGVRYASLGYIILALAHQDPPRALRGSELILADDLIERIGMKSGSPYERFKRNGVNRLSRLTGLDAIDLHRLGVDNLLLIGKLRRRGIEGISLAPLRASHTLAELGLIERFDIQQLPPGELMETRLDEITEAQLRGSLEAEECHPDTISRLVNDTREVFEKHGLELPA